MSTIWPSKNGGTGEKGIKDKGNSTHMYRDIKGRKVQHSWEMATGSVKPEDVGKWQEAEARKVGRVTIMMGSVCHTKELQFL